MRLPIVALLLIVGMVLGWGVSHRFGDPALRPDGPRPDVATIASASLASAQKQARLVTFAARFTVVVTSEHRTLGLTQAKTMIVPGIARYELDWTKLGAGNLAWNAAARTLRVDAPSVEIAGPEVELAQTREIVQGRTLMALTGSEPALDSANRARVVAEMLADARDPALVALARDATREAVARTFRLPLAAAGIDARILVRFPEERR